MGKSRMASWWRARWNLVGPYRLSRPLGRGLAGAVHLAKPLGGGAAVAVRLLRSDWAERPAFASRWVRSLHGASLREDPHVASLRALGDTGKSPWAAWEFVEGPSLGETLASATTPETALVALLQAARGLASLHENGLWHGGFGPDAARGNVESLVRLVDAGWPRDPDADDDLGPVPLKRLEASAERALREKAEAMDASQRRQDLAAFGRLMQTSSAVHDRPALRALAEQLTTSTSDDVSISKTSEVVSALESALKISGEVFRPHASETEALHEAARLWREAPAAGAWRLAVSVASGALLLLILLAVLAKAWLVALGLIVLGVLTLKACVAAGAIGGRDPLVDRVRALVFGMRWPDLAASLAVLVLTVVVLGVIGALRPLVILSLAAVVLGVLYRRELVRRLRQERQAPWEMAKALVEGLRRQGVAEGSIRAFVLREGTPGLFEAVFGAPSRAGEGASEPLPERILRCLRDGMISFLESRCQRRQDEERRALFVALEGRRQTAGGVNLLTARRRAWRVGDAMVASGATIREAARSGSGAQGSATIGATLRAAAMAPEAILVEHETEGRPALLGRVADVVLGPRARFLAGALLLAGCVLWMHQNGMLPHSRLREIAAQAAKVHDLESARDVGEQASGLRVRLSGPTRPLQVPGLPGVLAGWASRLGAGVAGLVLLLSSLRANRRALGLAWLGAAIAVFGSRGASISTPVSVAMAAGAALGALAMMIPGEKRAR